MKAARLQTMISGISRARITRWVEVIIAMPAVACRATCIAILTYVLILLMGWIVKTLVTPGLCRTSSAIAVMTLLVLISTGFRGNDRTGSWIGWSIVAFFLTLITILWPVTNGVPDKSSVVAYIIFLIFCMEQFDLDTGGNE